MTGSESTLDELLILARRNRCMHCYLHLASLRAYEKADQFLDAKGVRRAILNDAASMENESTGFVCKCLTAAE